MRVDHAEAVAFLRAAGPEPGGAWADVGAGEGTFTRALAELLGAEGYIVALDRDPRALEALEALAEGTRTAAPVEPVWGDLEDLDAVTALRERPLDGVLLANVLHYLADPVPALAGLASRVGRRGRLVVVEYDRRSANPWVPHPLPRAALRDAAEEAGLAPPRVVARRPSLYQGELYCAVLGSRPSG